MVLITSDGKIYVKILLWGISESGKTKFLKLLFQITKELRMDIIPVGELQIINRDNGATLLFDRGLFKSTKHKKVFYRVYTVPGQKRSGPLRNKLFDRGNDPTDAVIFAVDSRTKFLEDNIESLLELKNLAKDRLLKEIPMNVLLNKRVLEYCITKEDFIKILRTEDLWYDSGHKLSQWNPRIYEANLSYEESSIVNNCFLDCVRRITIRQGGDFYPYPFIFKPPVPPDDIGVSTNMQRNPALLDEEPEVELFCRYCGSPLGMDESFCSVCGKKS